MTHWSSSGPASSCYSGGLLRPRRWNDLLKVIKGEGQGQVILKLFRRDDLLVLKKQGPGMLAKDRK